MVLTEQVYWAFKKVSRSQSHIKARLSEEYDVTCEKRRCAGKWENPRACFVGIKLKEQVEMIL